MTFFKKIGQLWKSRLYRSLFFSYAIVLLIPILVSPLILYGVGDTISLQINRANETSLTLLRDAADAQIKEIYMTSSYLLIHEASWSLRQKTAFSQADTADLYRLQTMLKNSINQSAIIKDMYLCFPQADAVLDRSSLTYGSGFAYTAATRLGMDYEQWERELQFAGRRKHLLIGSAEEPFRQQLLIYHQYNRIQAEGAAPIVVVTVVNLDTLRGLLQDYSSGAAFLSIEDSSQTTIVSFPSQKTEEKPSLLQRLFYHGLSDQEASSNTMNLVYRLTPELNAANLSYGTPTTMVIYYALCLIIGFLLVFVFSRNHYTPVQRLTDTLLNSMRRTQPDNIEQNEYAFLELELTHMLQTLRDSDRQIVEMQNLHREKLLHDMIWGRADAYTESRLEELGLQRKSQPYLLVLYSVDQIDLRVSDNGSGNEGSSLQLIDLVISRVAASFQPMDCTTRLFTIEHMIACLVLAENSPLESAKVIDSAEKALSYLHDRLGITATAAISDPHQEWNELPEAYREAQETLESMALQGQEQRAGCFEELKTIYDRSEQDGFSQQVAFQQTLIAFWHAQQYDQMQPCFLNEVNRVFSGAASMPRRQLELFLDKYIGLLWGLLAEIPETDIDKNGLEEKLLECRDILALKSCAEEVFAALTQASTFKPDETPSERDLQIVAYIQEHYTDCDLNINALSDHFHLSPSYLSKIVRRCVDSTALEYIQNMRIAKAKELLTQTDLSLQEIAEAVGYGNKLNIIRAFKRSQGVTPGVYRKQTAFLREQDVQKIRKEGLL